MSARLWTIGHSSHTAERLAELLVGQGIACVVDVRSVPYSRRHPQHRREAMAEFLSGRGIAYVWEGETLGGRPDLAKRSNLCGPSGKPDWGKVRTSEVFQEALDRLQKRAAEAPTAILCAEENPRDCHRLHLVAAAWVERFRGKVLHIRGNGKVEAEGPPAQMGLFGEAKG